MESPDPPSRDIRATVHGVVPTALSAGEATVAAIRAAATDGTKSGTNRCARLVIGCATR